MNKPTLILLNNYVEYTEDEMRSRVALFTAFVQTRRTMRDFFSRTILDATVPYITKKTFDEIVTFI